MKKNLIAIFLLVILTVFSTNIFGGHSTLDIVDPGFNPQIQTSSYGVKWVNQVQVLPDGKILALGGFNTYNRVPVGKLVRLNADGSLDTTFNNQTVTDAQTANVASAILVQPDGKIVLKCVGLVAGGLPPRQLIRLNADGTLDTTFNFAQTNFISLIGMDSLGRFMLMGDFTTPLGARRLIRINGDGSLDNTFDFPVIGNALEYMAMQGDRVIVNTNTGTSRQIYRLNEDGSADASFTTFTGSSISLQAVQPDNKILYFSSPGLLRLNENGGIDSTFQSPDFSGVNGQLILKFTGGSKIVASGVGSPTTFKRFLPDGTLDPSFTPYTTTKFASFTILPDDSIVMGDADLFSTGSNNFIKLSPSGVPDPTFNTGGTGFKFVLPGVIQAIEPQADGKILLGGRFDLINEFSRSKLARLNADSTVDTTFQVNTTGGSGNYFSQIREVYQIRAQADGKMVVSGWFDYVLNNVTKQNIVRLNSDGSIDPTFNLTFSIPDYSQILLGGQNRFATYSDGKLMVGTSKANNSPSTPGPVRLTEGGARDTSFNPTLNGSASSVYFDDVAIQPDGKVVASGSYDTNSSSGFKSFIVRYNSNGTVDTTFSYVEETGRIKAKFVVLPNGKILVGKYTHGGGFAKLLRLNSDGSVDSSFVTVFLTDSAAKINALLVMPNGKIFVGGKFTVSVNGQAGKNLFKLSEDGIFEPTTYNLNEEVLGLAADSEGRVLVGGGFTVIGANGAGATRSYIARLTDSRRFDFDGDGKADISIFRPTENCWYVIRSSDSGVTQQVFALSGDLPTPGDWDGDGRTDFSVYRPTAADWWHLSSVNSGQIYAHWGFEGIIPLPSDIDADGKTDYVVYYPGNNYWYRYGTSAGASFIKFGAAGDKPIVADFDGDDKTDLAVYRPSTGEWWWQSSIDNIQRATQWGMPTDTPVPADYDGDGKTDIAIYRESSGEWWILNSSNGTHTVIGFGGNTGDKPVAADYDGDGKDDIAIYRPLEGNWYLYRSTAGFTVIQFGGSGDIPVPNVFIH